MTTDTRPRIREIPYNYTSFTDHEIIVRYLGQAGWHLLEKLRDQRRTGRSARMLFEILGDMWVIQRNPFIQDDLLANTKRRTALFGALYHRLDQFSQRAQASITQAETGALPDESARQQQAEVGQQALRLGRLARDAVDLFKDKLLRQQQLREQLRRQLSKLTAPDNLCFDGLSRVSHATDATDWRVEHPLAVLTPDREDEIPALVQACMSLGLPIIPRGGGTGYTGSAVPLHDQAVVINTEKLEQVGAVELRRLPSVAQPVPCVRVEAGAVTQRVAEQAARAGLVFAVDPTSQEASTIGGNIAMNAGGKKAVLWGTTLDNLASWRMVVPDGRSGVVWLEVVRLNHNLGKIHFQETVTFNITRYAADGKTVLDSNILSVPGAGFRKLGLGKDVTDKALFGLPGVQKEGCDGLITSAVFILHPQHRELRTVCMEFFGTVREAVPAIIETVAFLQQTPGVVLAGLEHLDERYLKAVKYSTKAARAKLPKMVLLADIGGEDAACVDQAAQAVVTMTQPRHGEGFIAASPEARQRFWAERKRTAAIAEHTNAFKVNEDVVIPLEKLADYSDGIERINIEQSIQNKLQILDALGESLDNPLSLRAIHPDYANSQENDEILTAKIARARALLAQVREQWQRILANFDAPLSAHPDLQALVADAADNSTVFQVLQNRSLRISYRQAVSQPLQEIFGGREFEAMRQQFDAIHAERRPSRLFVALHMHAGDGNVHTNIPVNSHDYAMMQAAEHIVARIMQLALSLGGVISGEHGIGLTKLVFLEPEKRAAFAHYKEQVDPGHFFNRGKLLAGADLQQAYTPSLRLVQQEALILEATDLGELNKAIKDCLRCGKCKPKCTTHVPRANLLYSPRNKILATGLIIEAVLYEEQTRRGISVHHFAAMNDVADHCTVCHRCLNPCPVNIDFGDVTIKMRDILKKAGKRRFNPGAWLSMQFLNISQPLRITLMRMVLIQGGYAMQRLGYRLAKLLGLTATALEVNKHPVPPPPRKTTGQPSIPVQVINFVKKPMPDQIPVRPLRGLLNIEDATQVAILRDPQQLHEQTETVFYFPGCGSERLFSQVGMATLAMLYDSGVQTVLPPGYLCCGYPQTASGDLAKGQAITTRNRVLFHRVANTLNYLDIKTVLVSCGTCMDQLLKYEFQQIFPGCRLLDIHEFLMEKGIALNGIPGMQYLYHDPCHSPMKQYAPLQVAEKLLGQTVSLSDRCCGEAGTFAIARPDIATQVRFRKQAEIQQGVQQLIGTPKALPDTLKILTSCPACQQGLARYRDDTGAAADYLVVELANYHLGEAWQTQFLKRVTVDGIERVLL